jgi:spermidine synthase
MNRHVSKVALLLFGSGMSALVYQTVWLRQFRLIFGASTLASAAVLAVFLGGLGIGGVVIGRRADESRNPLALYGFLELGVATFAAITPLVFAAVRALYLFMGGSFVMGPLLATIVRLLLSIITLGVPTFLMGGTLPAASRSVESAGDTGRRALATIYAINTCGAVAGALFSTFYLLEHFGNRATLWVAALVNAMVGLGAMMISNSLRRAKRGAKAKRVADEIEVIETTHAAEVALPVAAPRFVYAAAAVAGFAFLLMELVWYRMLTPLLGGTTFTFGLILAVALLGIGGGSLAYAAFRRTRASAAAFALCCAAEAFCLAIPFALGDRVAMFALLLRPLGQAGFSGHLIGWTTITMLIVFPTAFVSGVQFPLLISLLGSGRENVGRHVGVAYAWNTAGAIVGSLAGGFGILPLLTAPGTWRLVIGALVLLALVAAFQGTGDGFARLLAMVIGAGAVAMLFAMGPTAFWRHTPIGAGRVNQTNSTPNRLRDLEHSRRRTTEWEAEGTESSVSVSNEDGYAFIVNGKGDGHARFDAGTQVMGGVLAALLHPHPRRAAVIGLGTGTTAGWLASLPTIERVDAVEIEPSIVQVAKMCTAVNRDVLHNPKAHIAIGDGREFLLSRGDRYDIISAEPSNPYRAGIASLFTTEFYEACRSRLNDGGLFIQFLQAYEVDAQTIKTIYGTIGGVFTHVETWQSQSGDLLLVGAMSPISYDAATISARMRVEPVRTALRNVWWADDAAAVIAHYVCGNSTARILGGGARRNTDDRTLVEYAFARTLGVTDVFRLSELRNFARAAADDVPPSIRGTGGEPIVISRRQSIGIPHDAVPEVDPLVPDPYRMRAIAQARYVEGSYADVWTIWQSLNNTVESPLEALTLAEALAERGDPNALTLIDRLQTFAPIEADLLRGRMLWRQGKSAEAAAAMQRAFVAYRTNPWPLPIVMRRSLMFAIEIASDQRFAQASAPIIDGLSQPFAVEMFEELRKSALITLIQQAAGGACTARETELLHSYEPNIPWQHAYLQRRARCYEQTHDALAIAARREFEEYVSREPKRLQVSE